MNLPSCHLLDPMNGARLVDARWRRVRDLLARSELAAHRWDDGWVRAGLYYARQLSACHTPADRRALARRMPEVDAAHALYTHPDRLTRGEVEARLLAGQGVEGTAAACGLAADVVGVYVRLFFDVIHKLKAREYIMLFAVGGRIWDGSPTEADTDILLKYFAFLKGPVFLEPLLCYFRSGLSVPERPDRATAAELDELLDGLLIRALVLATVLPFEKLGRVKKIQRLIKRLKGYVARRHAADAVRRKADVHEPQQATPADSSAADATPVPTTDSAGRPVRWWASLRAERNAA